MKASKFVEFTMILQKFYLTNLSDLLSLKCFLLELNSLFYKIGEIEEKI